MHFLVEFENIRAAYALADYLEVIGIHCEVQQQAQRGSIYIKQKGDFDRARHELKDFLENPQDKKYLAASWEQNKGPKRPGIKQIYRPSQEGGISRWQQTGTVTKSVVGICAVVFLMTAFGSDHYMVQYFFFFENPSEIFDLKQFYRWITPVFLHFGVMHFAFNLLWWWDMGSSIERFQGPVRLVSLFVPLAIIPNIAQFIASGHRFGGLSGVVFGVLGYVAVYGRLRPDYPMQLKPVILYLMVGWMMIGFSGALDQVVGPMANLAHLAGLLTGALLAVVYALKDRAVDE